MPDSRHHHHQHSHPLERVAILGVGLIGGSLGQDLCALGASDAVVGWDARAEALADAQRLGAIQRVAESPEEAVRGARLVVIATPVGAVIPILERIAPHLPPGAVVTDVASAKARIVREAEAIIDGRFVGGHPMAGSAESGVAASSVDLFDAAAWILTPTERTDPGALAIVTQMVELAGARPRLCDPETHDRLVASLSHLPHLLAYALSETAGARIADEWADLAAGSFRDGARVALSDPARWSEILLDNRGPVAGALRSHLEWTRIVLEAVERGDLPALQGLLTEAHAQRCRFPR